MESPNNGTDRNLNELHPQISLSSDSITPEKREPVLFASDELLVKGTISQRECCANDIDSRQPSPLTLDVSTTETLWAGITPPSTTTADGELPNFILPPSRPQLKLLPAPTIEYEIVSQGRDLALAQIQSFLTNADAIDRLKLAFDLNPESQQTIASILASWQSLPSIEVVSSNVLGNADGAFDAVGNKIYLASDLVARRQLDLIVSVLIEEVGHYLDIKLNGNRDSAGDEGAIFSKLVRGKEIAQKR